MPVTQIDITASISGIHFIEFGLDNDELSSFSIQLWITKTGVRMCDWVQAMGLNFISFMSGDVWVHNDEDQARCNLFGEKRDCIIGVISNEDPLRVKIFDTLEIDSDSEWEVMEITIPASLNYPSGMYSKIPKERFKKRDGYLRAEFLRNMKTKDGTANVIDALSGEPLRGNAIYMKLRNISNSQVRLFKCVVSATKSRV